MRTGLARLELANSFETFGFSEELAWAEPAPEIFEAVPGQLGEDPSAMIHRGDS